MANDRRRAIYRGRVQGVGFRFTAERLAGGFDVSGFVRNLDDGTVEVVAEGAPDQVSGFLDAIGRGMGDRIRGVDVGPLPPGDPPFSGFSIRY